MKTIKEIVEIFVPRLENVSQNIIRHPEGNVLNHTLQVFYWSIKETKKSEKDLRLAALFHDIGKFTDSNNHPRIACEWLCQLVNEKVIWLIDNHIRIKYYIDGTMKKQSKIRKIENSIWITDLLRLTRWDNLGRNPKINLKFDLEEIVKYL